MERVIGNETRFKWTMYETKGVDTDYSLKKCGGKEMRENRVV